jgi:cell fate (sporulation/competence/biofilm development) regulator YmcA (YheA/YmcA/DUF963 family)
MNFEREFAVFQAAMEIQSCLEEIQKISMSNQIAEATRTISTGLDVIKKMTDIAVKIKNIELQEAVLELKTQILSATPH